MKIKALHKKIFLLLAIAGFSIAAYGQSLRISIQHREPSPYEDGAFVISRIELWKPSETALIVCDMCAPPRSEKAHVLPTGFNPGKVLEPV
jgi:hypothetical protein